MTKIQWCPDIANIEEATNILTAKFQHLKYEQAYIEFDNGKIGRIQGGKDSINPTHKIRQMLQNAQMIHNHPTPNEHPRQNLIGLSGTDIGFAAALNLKSIAVLDTNKGIKITRPKEGWKHIAAMLTFLTNSINWEIYGKMTTWNLN